MLNPQFVAGEHGLFGGHKSEDIRTFLTTKVNSNKNVHFSVYYSNFEACLLFSSCLSASNLYGDTFYVFAFLVIGGRQYT